MSYTSYMWCERVVRNVGATWPAEGEGRTIDVVDVAWDECRNVLKKTSRGGEPVRVLLPTGQRLRHGDVLRETSTSLLLVSVAPCRVVVARPRNVRETAILALELGNLHCPTQVIDDGTLAFVEGAAAINSDAALNVVRSIGVPWSLETRAFEPAPLCGSPAVGIAEAFCVIRSTA